MTLFQPILYILFGISNKLLAVFSVLKGVVDLLRVATGTICNAILVILSRISLPSKSPVHSAIF